MTRGVRRRRDGVRLAATLALWATGCHGMPIGRVDPALDPRRVGRTPTAPMAARGELAQLRTQFAPLAESAAEAAQLRGELTALQADLARLREQASAARPDAALAEHAGSEPHLAPLRDLRARFDRNPGAAYAWHL